MKTVKEISRISGVSVRTLHHYDAIGLLKPARITESGYRLYDEASLQRLQTILLFRQLQFPLKEIRQILDDPQFDPMLALQQQIQLLQLQRQHLDDLISHALQIQKKGRFDMDFSTFDTSKLDRYAAEAKEKWGKTDAYQEFEEKTAGQSFAQLQSTGDGLMNIFREFGAIRHLPADTQEAQALVKKLQDYITAHYYTCTKQILQGLGSMYIAGDSMTENIDAAGGEGTAQFVHRAIQIFCS
jgi:DNA-binding transcriptional MerR regulator